VAAVVCFFRRAGELLAGLQSWLHSRGTPRTIQIVKSSPDCASLSVFPAHDSHEGNKHMGGIGFGDPTARAASRLDASSHRESWAANGLAADGVGIMLGIAMILIQVRSPCW